MGAATAILYTAKYGGIKGIISDNSYADLDMLINELSDDYLPFLPSFLVNGIINSIQEYIEELMWKSENTDFNIRKLKPNKVIDVQSLAGDSSDNIPGVPGIGPKTAAELINKYKDLDNLLKKAGEIPQNKRRETLLPGKYHGVHFEAICCLA